MNIKKREGFKREVSETVHNDKGEMLISYLSDDEHVAFKRRMVDYIRDNFAKTTPIKVAKHFNIPYQTARDIYNDNMHIVAKEIMNSPALEVIGDVSEGLLWKGQRELLLRFDEMDKQIDIKDRNKIMNQNEILKMMDMSFKISQTIKGEPSMITGKEGMSNEQLMDSYIKMAENLKKLKLQKELDNAIEVEQIK